MDALPPGADAMTETREQVLELAAQHDLEAETSERLGARPGMTNMDQARYADIAAGKRTIARALRLLAETMGREAEPVAWVNPLVINKLKRQGGEITANMRLVPFADDVAIFTSPAPGYAAGRRDGLEEAAERMRRKSDFHMAEAEKAEAAGDHDGFILHETLHDAAIAAEAIILALKEGK
jgi:hypothetical protein